MSEELASNDTSKLFSSLHLMVLCPNVSLDDKPPLFHLQQAVTVCLVYRCKRCVV